MNTARRAIVALALLTVWGGGCAKVPFMKKETPPPAPTAEAPPPPVEVAPASPAAPAPSPEVQRPAPAPRPTPRPVQPTVEPSAQAPKAAFVCPPSDPVTARKHWIEAVNSLQVGEGGAAKRELQLALCQEPDNKTARSLLDQIEQPPEALFGTRWTEYTVQPGDTLSKIAERFLGDPLLFYGVARYNQLENPSRLKVGDTVRVPSRRTAAPPTPTPPPAPPAAKEEPAEAPPADRTAPTVTSTPKGGSYTAAIIVSLGAVDDSDPHPVIHYTVDGTAPDAQSPVYDQPLSLETTTTLRFLAVDASGNASPVRSETYTLAAPDRYAEARQQVASGQYEAAIGKLETAVAAGGGDAEARALLVSAYTRYGDALSAQGKLTAAQDVLQKAAALAPGDQALRDRLQRLESRVGVEQMYQNGLQASESGDLEKALSDFQKVLELDPSHKLARAKLEETRKDLVEVYSKRAQAAFRRQELDEAINRWDQVLALDPNNELAKLRRAEAVDLRARFEQKFESKPAAQ